MSRFAKYAWFVSGYTILVILWGAVVRATGSGAGCGNHWPTCNGDILHRPEQIETLIELSHRLTSAATGIFIIILLVWAFMTAFKYNQKLIRNMAIMTFIFVIIEGGLGAALVKFELVEDNASVARAIVVGLHLINTLILLGFSTLTAWAASQKRQISFKMNRQGSLMLIGLVGMILLSSIGAVTALGDTLFPAESLIDGIRQDLDPTANFLIQLRIWHPILAVLLSGYLFWVGYQILDKTRNQSVPQIGRTVNALFTIITLQIVGGFVNVVLLAPVWMQVVHLLLADLMWMAIVILAAEVTAQPQLAGEASPAGESVPATA